MRATTKILLRNVLNSFRILKSNRIINLAYFEIHPQNCTSYILKVAACKFWYNVNGIHSINTNENLRFSLNVFCDIIENKIVVPFRKRNKFEWSSVLEIYNPDLVKILDEINLRDYFSKQRI